MQSCWNFFFYGDSLTDARISVEGPVLRRLLWFRTGDNSTFYTMMSWSVYFWAMSPAKVIVLVSYPYMCTGLVKLLSDTLFGRFCLLYLSFPTFKYGLYKADLSFLAAPECWLDYFSLLVDKKWLLDRFWSALLCFLAVLREPTVPFEADLKCR
jgi:hypothetical protein